MDAAAVRCAGRCLTWQFAVMTGLGALLLFQVQPLISNFLLPRFGGSPAVWTTAMLFFQTALLGGYAYAHWSRRRWRPQTQCVVHVALLLAALVCLPIAPSNPRPEPSEHPIGQILLLLAASVGLPYLVLSSTGPLVQGWFCLAFPQKSPYRLYALSNLGSLVALVSYPLLVETSLDVAAQARWWSTAFVVFSVLNGVTAWQMSRFHALSPIDESREHSMPVSLWRRLLWLLLPAFASSMLLATTNHICRDVAVAPLLWIAPLALYLLTFIICFDHERWYWRLPFGVLAIVALYAAQGIDHAPSWSMLHLLSDFSDIVRGRFVRQWNPQIGYTRQLVVHLAALFAVCMVCHGELMRLRPASRDLTSYYLMIAAGGALGGMLVSLVAPHVFVAYFEWQLCLYAGVPLVLIVVLLPRYGRPRSKLRELCQLATVLVAGLFYYDASHMSGFVIDGRILVQRRNFYDVMAVAERGGHGSSHQRRQLYSGQIVHGIQFIHADRRRWATTYHADESGVGQALQLCKSAGQRRIGVVGLGVGTLASFAEQGDQFRFYEFNPEIPRLADEYFSFVADARRRGATIDILIGDGRLTLERELAQVGSQGFDLLAIDAFSGDTVPVHLLTAEAFETYQAHLNSNGVLAIHTSNRILNLARVVDGLAKHLGWRAVKIETPRNSEREVAAAEWIIVSRSDEFLAQLQSRNLGTTVNNSCRDLLLWTDQRHNLFEILH